MRSRPVFAVGLIVALTACASDIASRGTPVELVPTDAGGPMLTVSVDDAELHLTAGRCKPLEEGSVWKRVGALHEGAVVYAPVDDVLLVTTGHAYEAYLVVAVADTEAIGVYLPVEKVFIPARSPVYLRGGNCTMPAIF